MRVKFARVRFILYIMLLLVLYNECFNLKLQSKNRDQREQQLHYRRSLKREVLRNSRVSPIFCHIH